MTTPKRKRFIKRWVHLLNDQRDVRYTGQLIGRTAGGYKFRLDENPSVVLTLPPHLVESGPQCRVRSFSDKMSMDAAFNAWGNRLLTRWQRE
jgi:hypothetical protein